MANLLAGDPRSLASAIEALNRADVAVIQHEYGIYGGPDGDEVLSVLEGLRVHSIVVLHTVLAEPTARQRSVLEEVVRLATATVVMTESARSLLEAHYAVDLARVQVIPHGVTPLPRSRKSARQDRPTILTWGLIGPGKGIEWGIRALAHLTDMRPLPRYRVLGQTHPKVLAQDGDAYRDRLFSTARSLGLGDSVTLDGRYLSPEGLAQAIEAADIVLLPYDTRIQVTSGVLSEAVAAGKPVVATRFPHAVELLADGSGLVVPQEDPAAIAQAIRHILEGPGVAAAMKDAALRVSRETSWAAVGARYRALAVRLRGRVAA